MADLFDTSVFQSIETQFTLLKNMTTRTELNDLSNVSFISFTNHGFTFESEKTLGSKGHNLMIEIKVTLPGSGESRVRTFNTTAVIKESEAQDDGFISYEVELLQYEEKSWLAVTSAFTERQNEIMEFLRAAKG